MSALHRVAAAAPTDTGRFQAPTAAHVESKWPLAYHAIEPFAMAGDALAILMASLLAEALARLDISSIPFGKVVGTMMVVSSLFICLLKLRDVYRPTELLALRNQFRAVGLAWAQTLCLVTVAAAVSGLAHEAPRGAGLFAVLGFAALAAWRFALRRALRKGLSDRKFARRHIVLITDQPAASTSRLSQTLAAMGCAVAERFALPPPGASFGDRKRLGARVIERVSGSDVEEVVIEADPARWVELRALIAHLRVLPFPITYMPIGATAEIFRRPTRDVGAALCVELQRGPLSRSERVAKRALDIAGAGLALLALSPLLALTALAIKLDSPGPVLFRQKRCGFNGRTFAVRKFRTMSVLEDGGVIVQAQRRDARITRVGAWLRRTSIDELPQLLNVLEGTMSLVGPRPHALAHDDRFDKVVRNYAFRRKVKPGLSGWAQIHGCRGATPTTEIVERRIEYDLWYIENWSLKLDLTILLQTPLEVLRARNAF